MGNTSHAVTKQLLMCIVHSVVPRLFLASNKVCMTFELSSGFCTEFKGQAYTVVRKEGEPWYEATYTNQSKARQMEHIAWKEGGPGNEASVTLTHTCNKWAYT